ncbi:hypothetical protein M0813_21320 [Anaeramoeba flamelloides]|uniref:Ribosome biogenesis protein SLX9 n=1 Tax=Anaeramoeba flamelloides TaxID=1746091 RepID=A0ABQ8YHI0_9EUKA|nr:hypothetical protein M0813_21320 [Anaeramoeba flamelloides]
MNRKSKTKSKRKKAESALKQKKNEKFESSLNTVEISKKKMRRKKKKKRSKLLEKQFFLRQLHQQKGIRIPQELKNTKGPLTETEKLTLSIPQIKKNLNNPLQGVNPKKKNSKKKRKQNKKKNPGSLFRTQKQRRQIEQQEMEQFQNVLGNSLFLSNPNNAITEHLKSTILKK